MAQTCQKIIDRDIYWPKTIPPDAKDLINGLLASDPEKRLGGPELRKHKFFQDIDWKTLQTMRPPVIPDSFMGDEDRGVGIKMSMFEPYSYQDDLMAQSHVFKPRTKTGYALDAIKSSELLRKMYPQLRALPERPKPINSSIIYKSENLPKSSDNIEEVEVEDSKKVSSNETETLKKVCGLQNATTMKTPISRIHFGHGSKMAVSSSFQLKAFNIGIDTDANVMFAEQKNLSTVSSCNFLEYSPNGEYLAFDMQRQIGLVDFKSGGTKKKPKQLVGHPLPITKLSWHRHSTLLAAGGLNNVVYLWNVENTSKPKLQGQLEAHSSYISDLQFHPRENLLVTGGGDFKVIFHDSQSERVIQKFSHHEDVILGTKWNPRFDDVLCTWSLDRRLIILDKRTYKPVKILAHSRPIINAEWSPDGTMLSTCSRDSIRVWSYPTFTSSFNYTNTANLPGEFLSFDHNNKYLAVLKCREDAFPSIIDLENCGFVSLNKNAQNVMHKSPITCLKWSDEKSILATGSYDKNVQLW